MKTGPHGLPSRLCLGRPKNDAVQLINDFQLVPTERGDEDLITARVFKGGHKGALVSGAELVASVSWQQFFIIFATDGVDYEEFLNIHMFDDGLKLLDSAIIGAP